MRPGVVSVILVNFKGTADTLTSIEELTRTDWDRDLLEIIVVDNGSGDGYLAPLRASTLPFRLIETGANLGFTGGCNRGALEASGQYLAFLNNDARPDRSWIRSAIETFDSDADVGAVASKVLDWDGRNVDFTDAAMTWYGMGYKPFAGQPDDGRWDAERDVLFGTGAAMFIRAEVFDALEGFDDRYFMFYDDVDLGWRLNLLGWRFRYQPASLAFHKHHASMKAFGPFRETYLLERNAIFTLFKNLGDDELGRALPAALVLAVRRSVARAEVDSTQFDLRLPGDDGVGTIPIAKLGMAGVFALDQFAEMLPSLAESRRHIQRSRKRTDTDLRKLFGVMDEPAYPIEGYLDGYARILSALDPVPLGDRRFVVIDAGDTDARSAQRRALIAGELARHHQVEIVANGAMASSDDSSARPVRILSLRSALEHEWNLDPDGVVILDAATPEDRAHLAATPLGERARAAISSIDFFITESEDGRRWWLEVLIAAGRIDSNMASDAVGMIAVIASPGPNADATGEANPHAGAWAAFTCAPLITFIAHPTRSGLPIFAPPAPEDRPRAASVAVAQHAPNDPVRRLVRRLIPVAVRARVAAFRRRLH